MTDHSSSRRPKRLLVCDVEGTLFELDDLPGSTVSSTVWQALAVALGQDAIQAELDTQSRWANGGYGSYLDWMRATIEIHQEHGLTEAMFNRVVGGARYNAGVIEAMHAIPRQSLEFLLVSGGFRALAERAQRDFGIIHAFAACDYFFDEQGLLAGYNLLPCDFAGKLDFIRLMLSEYDLSNDAWVFVGDGANDRAIAQAAPFAVGYRPHPALAEVVDVVIDDFRELPSLLVRAEQQLPESE
jgi:phosphoserine phosphatase